ncbi:hypothetical protein LJB81_04735 [Desulfovibrio sp. OttesenSCG-928-M14]|nr:hypothetical protein [Desulfovibrio sp. OttesenSCG-928-M14]
MKDEPLGHSRSLCPVCLKALPAEIIRRGQDVLLERGKSTWKTEPI